MTVINPKSISGITSITTSSGADDLLTIHNYSGAERFRIDGDGNTRITSGIVTTLSVEAITGHIKIDDRILHTGDTNTMIRFPANDTFSVETAGVQRVTVDASGRLLVGGTSEYTAYSDSKIQVATNDSTASASFTRWSNDGSSPYLNLGKSRGSVGSYTVVQNGDRLGQINFVGADGTDMASHAASIAAYVDGSPGSNDMPGRIVFATSSDGGVAETERVRINSVGKVGINSTAPDGMLAIEHTSSSPNLTMRNHPAAGPYTNEYGLELRHAYGSVKHGALIHTQEAADARRSLDVSDSNGIFATFTNGKVGVGTITPTEKFEVHKASGTTLIKASVNGNSRVGFEIQKTGATTQTWRIQDGQSGNGILEFYDQTDSRSVMTLGGTGNVTVGAGNLIMGTAGKGIDFSATANTGTSELLDDYEEGTWTPTIAFSGGTTGITYNHQGGATYTKIGRMVHVRCYIMLSNKGSDTGNLTMHGFPFNSSNLSGGYTVVASWHTSMEIPGQKNIQCYIDSNSTTLRVHYYNTSNGDANNVTNTMVNNNSEIMIAGSYVTSA